MPGEVVIVDHDARWPAKFEEERGRIVAAIGPHVTGIEHIGSTAVPGLAAKPVIDVLVGLRSLDDARECIRPVVGLGYEYVPEFEAELPERRFFRKDTDGARSHHIHMVEHGSPFWVRHILFRDHLRTHPEDARRYEALKRELAARFRDDRGAYTEGKTAFVREIEDTARTERAASPGEASLPTG